MSANASTAPPARTQRGLAVCVWAIPSKPPGKASALTSEIGTPDATLALSTALSDANRTDEQVVLRGGCSPYPTKQWQQQLHPSLCCQKLRKKSRKQLFASPTQTLHEMLLFAATAVFARTASPFPRGWNGEATSPPMAWRSWNAFYVRFKFRPILDPILFMCAFPPPSWVDTRLIARPPCYT